MKKSLLLFFILGSFLSLAQKFTITKGTEFEAQKSKWPTEMLDHDSTGFYYFRSLGNYFSTRHAICKFDLKTSQLVYEKIIDLSGDDYIGGKSFNCTAFNKNGKILVFSQATKGKNNNLMLLELNSSTGEIIGKPQVVVELSDTKAYVISDAEIDTISHDYIEYLPDNNRLFDGAIEILDYLQPKYNLHIITNGFAEVQSKKIANSDLGHYFKTITNSEMAGVKKPHPNIFEFALSLAKVKKENAIMIGDCIDADVRGALDYGMEAILFDDKGFHSVKEIKIINHLLELKNIL